MSSVRIVKAAAERGRIRAAYPKHCEICGSSQWIQIHHKFHQNRANKRLYGDLIHHPKNRQYVCNKCHIAEPSSRLIEWSEYDFCAALGLEPRSEEAHRRKQREGQVL